MSETTPATGKWAVHGPEHDRYGAIEIRLDGRRVAELWQDDAPAEDYNAQQWAYARLIVAACNGRESSLKAMEGAKKLLLGIIVEDGDEPDATEYAVIRELDAAIAAAKGGTP